MDNKELQHWPIGRFIPYKNNPRKNDHAIEKISKAIEEFGFRVPVLAKSDGTVVDGHLRLKAAQKLKLETLPVMIVDDMTEAQIIAFRISINKMADLAEWDIGLLRGEFDRLTEFGYDIELTGFGVDELCDLFPFEEPEALVDADDCPEAPAEPVTKLGDVWLLGDHRLMCGDSTVQTDVDKLMNGQAPNTMVTDPPYGVKYEADWRAEAKGRKKTKREENSNLKNDDQADWFDAYVLFTGSVAYVWHASSFTDVVMNGLRRAGFDIKQQIIWNKNIHALSRSDYHWKHEPCWYAVKQKGERNWKGGRTQMTVWDVPSVVCEKDKTAHPTQKPVELFVRSINHHTNPGEYVYDPFAGSGTLMVACEKTGRRALCMELDPKYCDIIKTRYENFTGKKAELESNDARSYTSQTN